MSAQEQEQDRSMAPRRRSAATMRSVILHCAAEAFAQRGLDGASMGQIGEASGCGKRMLYHYFENKEALYASTLQAANAALLPGDLAADLDDRKPSEALAWLTGRVFDGHLANPIFSRLLIGELLHPSGDIAEIVSPRPVAVLQTVLHRGIAEGEFLPDVDPLELYLSIHALGMISASGMARGPHHRRASAVRTVMASVMRQPAAFGAG